MIAPSLLNADTYHVKEMLLQIQEEKVTYLHIDIADGHFVPLMSFGANTVRDLKKATDFVLDCHLMVDSPERQIETIIEAGADIITIHAEAENHMYRMIQTIHKSGRKAGIAINPGTPVSAIKEILPITDLILVMTVNPGVPGETFIEQTVGKIEKLNQIREKKNYKFQIQVDGNITDKTIGLCKAAGADIFVSGGYIFGGDIRERIRNLRTAGAVR